MKFRKIILFVLAIILITFGIIYFIGNNPKISITATISPISKDELSTATSTSSNISKPNQDDFKKLSLKINIKNQKFMKEKSVTLPNLKQDIQNFSDSIYVYDTIDKSEGFSGEIYENETILFIRGINEDNIRNIFKDSTVSISWKDKDGNTQKNKCIIGDILKFEK